jgi:hypothetical protein
MWSYFIGVQSSAVEFEFLAQYRIPSAYIVTEWYYKYINNGNTSMSEHCCFRKRAAMLAPLFVFIQCHF